MLIIVVTSTGGKYTNYFHNPKENSFFFLDSTLECELCVYGREKRETEMITRVLLRTQLGASLN